MSVEEMRNFLQSVLNKKKEEYFKSEEVQEYRTFSEQICSNNF